MDFNPSMLRDLLEKLAVPIAVGLISWFIKDYLVGEFAKREQAVKAEWTYRLTEVWSPLFYWTVVALFNEKKGWDKHGMRELETLLSKSAHLLPLRHYNALISVLEVGTGQRNAVSIEPIRQARDFVYKQVETYNYLLFRKSGWFDAAERTDLFGTAKGLMRLLSQAVFHLVVWLAVFGILIGLYGAYITGYYAILIIAGVFLLAICAIDVKHRWNLYSRIARAVHSK